MLRKRTFPKRLSNNYITATYNGSGNIKLFGDAYPINNIEAIINGKKDIGAVKSYNFTSGGDHILKIYLKPGQTSCGHMFDQCPGLTQIDLKHFDMSMVDSLSGMFYKDTGLTVLSFENLNWSSVRQMNSFCSECSNLTRVSFKGILSHNVVDLAWCFNWTSLTEADLSGLDVSKVTNMSHMFENCWSLTTLRIMSSVESLTNRDSMFYLIFTKGTLYCNKKYDYSKLRIPFRWSEVRI